MLSRVFLVALLSGEGRLREWALNELVGAGAPAVKIAFILFSAAPPSWPGGSLAAP